jgi:hypothetical protein
MTRSPGLRTGSPDRVVSVGSAKATAAAVRAAAAHSGDTADGCRADSAGGCVPGPVDGRNHDCHIWSKITGSAGLEVEL